MNLIDHTLKEYEEFHKETYAIMLDGVAAMRSARAKFPESVPYENIVQMKKDAETYRRRWL